MEIYGITILLLVLISFISIINNIFKRLKNDDVQQAIFNYIEDIGFNKLQVIQLIIQFIPYLISGALIMILIGMLR